LEVSVGGYLLNRLSALLPIHTPGQIALHIHSENDHLLYISDAFLHPLHIEQLDWQTNYDLDHNMSKQSRIKLLEFA
jgi:glyoxylase-like metal-dependent hydrolase (beta-lactamase superfamily II)